MDGGFPDTSYSMIRRLTDSEDPGFRAALERLSSNYWKPVYCMIRFGWGKSDADACDLTQDFFASMVLERDLVRKFAPDRGSFRTFLKAAVTNFLRDAAKSGKRLKRGGGSAIVPFDASQIVPDSKTLTPEEVFDKTWKNLVLASALEHLERILKDQGRAQAYEAFLRYDVYPESPQTSYQTVAEALGLSPDTVKNHLTLARSEFRRAVEQVIADSVEGPTETDAEFRALFGA